MKRKIKPRNKLARMVIFKSGAGIHKNKKKNLKPKHKKKDDDEESSF